MPCESIIVPAFNSGKTIRYCLRAIRDSTFKDYELIVIDDCSQDDTSLVAKEYADKVIELDKHSGRNLARMTGIQSASGEILVNIDSDVLIRQDTLSKINEYFSRHPYIDALTGCLSKENRNKNFFSKYKNLYMHYIFSKLPERITFLYGSIFALRRTSVAISIPGVEIGEDLALGQQLFASGKHIAFVKGLEVEHLRRHSFVSFIRNDFSISFNWAKVFIMYKGLGQLFRNRTGFAHSPRTQIISVIVSPVCVLAGIFSPLHHAIFLLSIFLFIAWSLLNLNFIYFLAKEESIFFGALAFFVTFFDNIVMAMGILCGLSAIIKKRYK